MPHSQTERTIMYRTGFAALLGLVAAGLLATGAGAVEDKKAEGKADDKHMAMFKDCAKACDDCKRMCDTCGAHCAKMLADGQKMHYESLKTCQDCAAICAAAACVTAKQGPFSDIICTACADACKRCGDTCEKHAAHDAMMKECAAECRKCEKACRDMLAHVKPAAAPAK